MAKSKRPRGDNVAAVGKDSGGGSRQHQQKRQKRDNQRRRGNNNNSSSSNNKPDMLVRITRVELTDDYVHAPAPLATVVCSADEIGQEKHKDEVEVSSAKKEEVETTAEGANEQTKEKVVAEDKAADKSISHTEPTEEGKKAEPSGAAVSSASIEKVTSDTAAASTKKPRQPFIKIIKAKSAKHKPKFQHANFEHNYKPLPDGDCGDGIKNPHSKEEVPDKYWAQRRRLFSRYDEGIQLDKESWYSVTPEAIAYHIAQKMAKMAKRVGSNSTGGAIVLDPFCGCGGNAIAFARLSREDISLVVCIDIDPSKLEMAAHNAAIYGVAYDRIVFIEADAISAMKYGYSDGSCIINATSTASVTETNPNQEAGNESDECTGYKIGGLELLPPRIDAVFLSPPWGGINYGKAGKMNYHVAENIKLPPCGPEQKKSAESYDTVDSTAAASRDVVNGEELLAIAGNASVSKLVAYFLPRNTNGVSLGRAALKAGYGGSLEMEQNFLNGKHKTMTAYLSVNNETS